MVEHAQPDARPRVALIEDDDYLAMVLTYNLEAAGFLVDWMRDGREGLERVRETLPALIVLDWSLPALSGIELLKQVRNTAATRSVPVVMVTGRTDAIDRSRALSCGADAFLTKPFSIEEFTEAVRAAAFPGSIEPTTTS